MNKIFTILALALCINLSSCDKLEDSFNRSQLSGTWQLVWSVGYERDAYSPNKDREWNEMATNEILNLNPDGTGRLSYIGGYDEFQWVLDDDQLSMYDSKQWRTLEIEELNRDMLKLEYFEKSGSYEYYVLNTYKKI